MNDWRASSFQNKSSDVAHPFLKLDEKKKNTKFTIINKINLNIDHFDYKINYPVLKLNSVNNALNFNYVSNILDF